MLVLFDVNRIVAVWWVWVKSPPLEGHPGDSQTYLIIRNLSSFSLVPGRRFSRNYLKIDLITELEIYLE
jgi:hypothetical protein